MSRRLRIALISEHASPLAAIGSVDAGGQNVYVAHVARGLAAAGHHVDVLTRRDSASLATSVDICPGVRVLHIPAGPPCFVPKEQLLGHMPAFADAACDLVRNSLTYDVVHANFYMSGLVGLRLKERFGLPLVVTFHALGLVRRAHQREADAFPAERIDIERRLARECDRVIAECPQDERDLVQLYGTDPARISMVPCGVDLGEFSPGCRTSARREIGVAEGEFVVLQLGRMVPRKGVDNVIRAVARLDADTAARLVVVGGETADADATPEIARLRAVARECGVADRVSFTGQRSRDRLRAYYRACDVFVTTPWYEPFGITPLEAMATARPVVGSAVGGIQHTVVDGVTGFLVPPRDPEALAERLRQLHDNPALGQAMGLAGARRARSLFTWQRVADELARVYGEVFDARCAVDADEAARAAAEELDGSLLGARA